MKNIYTYKIFVVMVFCLFAAATTEDSSSSSSSSSPYSNVNAALSICADELRSDTARGKYDHLSDTAMYRAMEADQERCMARYGHYPN